MEDIKKGIRLCIGFLITITGVYLINEYVPKIYEYIYNKEKIKILNKYIYFEKEKITDINQEISMTTILIMILTVLVIYMVYLLAKKLIKKVKENK